MSNPIPAAEMRFIDDLAALMVPWGWQRNVGRMYAYLLLQDEPIGLDELAAALGIAKSNASVAARTLEQFGNARRHTEPGTKRIRYSAPGTHTGPFTSRVELLGRLVALLHGEDIAHRSGAVTERLQLMADFYRDIAQAMQESIDRQRPRAETPARSGHRPRR